MEKSKWVVVFEGVLSVVWVVAMGLAGFFLPGFLTAVPVFKIKEVYVYGLRSVPEDVFSSGVYQVSKNNGLFLDSKKLLEKVNKLTNNSLEAIEAERLFSLDGVRVNVYVKERTPIAYVVYDGEVWMMDERGELFYNPRVESDLPTIYTFSLDYIKTYHHNLVGLLRAIDLTEAYVAYHKTTIYTKNGKAILSPLSELSPMALDRVKKIYSNWRENRWRFL
jgi:Cell division septal protein